MSTALTLEDLDNWFETHKPQKPAAPAKPKAATKPPAPEKYWLPEAVVLWQSSWVCRCGCSGPATPELFVRERQGKAIRLRAIRCETQYSLLPRFIEDAEPSHIQSCPNCFAGSAEFIVQQFVLPFPEDLSKFKQNLIDAVAWAAELDEMLVRIEERRVEALEVDE